jgi:hypothetical protein
MAGLGRSVNRSVPIFGPYGMMVRIQALGRCHIGGGAHCVWALPPKVGGTAHRHVQVHSHTTSAIPTVKQRLLQ